MAVEPAASFYLAVLLLLWGGAVLAEFEIVEGPGENSTLFCDRQWIAWRNNTRPLYDLFFYNYPCQFEINGSLVNETCNGAAIKVLEGSMPIIEVGYFEEGENGTLGRPVICFTPPAMTEVPDSTPRVVVIYVTSSLAIIASLIALVTHILLPRMRTLPGLVILNLFLSFLLGDILLQVRIGLEYNGHYYTINYVLQQGFLVSRFVWMSITGFEMCRSLYKGIRMQINSHNYHKWMMLAVYMIIGWGITVILMIIIGVVEEKGGKEVKSALGAFGYITTIAPIATTQLINIGAVVFISIAVVSAARQQNRVTQRRLSKKNINFVRLFLIILTVLGLVWLLSFVVVSLSDLASKDSIVIPYVIVTNTQPVFVCIAFICTPNVFKMCLVRFHIRNPESLRRSTQTGTVTSMVSSTERGFGRGRTQMVSLNHNIRPPSERVPPPLQAIAEEGGSGEEDGKDEGVGGENGNGVGKSGEGKSNGNC